MLRVPGMPGMVNRFVVAVMRHATVLELATALGKHIAKVGGGSKHAADHKCREAQERPEALHLAMSIRPNHGFA